jgi:two-component system chemotaxis sensor kinase CheA
MNDDLFDTSELLDDFVDDARGHLARLDEVALRFEKTVEAGFPDPSLLEPVLGPLHTLKGNSGMMGFARIQKAVHEFETFLKPILSGERIAGKLTADAIFSVSSLLRRAVEGLASEKREIEEFGSLHAILAVREDNEAASPGTAKPSPAVEAVSADVIAQDAGLGQESNMIKIDFKRLDRLLNLVGELVMYRTSLAQLQSELTARLADQALGRELGDVSQLMGKTVTELQEAIMEARLLPMKQVLAPFPRLVRDTARARGKKVNIHLRGADTELDKTVIDKIGEPLLHLVRNAVDHGIEKPADRVFEGKPEAGNITITAAQESNSIVITVEDDGAGLDAEKILAKARRMGLVEGDRKLTDVEIHELIFAKGFSTADQITEISGRGVGMDVVKEIISGLGGTIEIDTIRHMGTKFVIKLPLTLAIISALLVQIDEEIYAVPITHVLESVRLDRAEVHTVNDIQMMQLRDRVLPLTDLRTLMQLQADSAVLPYVVVLGRGERRVGLVVDRLLGQLEIVIKGLDDALGNSKYISGASVLGDGRVILILDAARLLSGETVSV